MGPTNGTLSAKKPSWLNKRIAHKDCRGMKELLKGRGLNTVCTEAMCPNISECFGAGVATFLILGKNCTRNCKFCAVMKGKPERPDPDEPARIARAVNDMKLKHVVITSVTRDDLPDGGAGHFRDCVNEIRQNNDAVIEVLVPDFNGNRRSISTVISAGPHVFAHNLETVPGLYAEVRGGADYIRSLKVLKAAKELKKNIFTKSGIMLGLGESYEDCIEVFKDIKAVGCDILTIGQYLAPSSKHYPVKEYIVPGKFESYKNEALRLGIAHVESAPYVRSSYLAARTMEHLST